MGDVENIRKYMAEKQGDSNLWTPLDALEDLIESVKKGEVNPSQLIIHFLEPDEEGGHTHKFQCAGISYPQHIALLEIAKYRVLKDWLK